MTMKLDGEVDEPSVVLALKPFVSPTAALGQGVESAKMEGSH